MTIAELDKELKVVIEEHSVYGAQAIINALVWSCKGKQYLEPSVLHALIEKAVIRDVEGD